MNLYDKHVATASEKKRFVLDEEFTVLCTKLEVDDPALKFDQNNPRLQNLLRKKFNGDVPPQTEENLYELLIETADVKMLAESLSQSGETIDPILVDANGNTTEGNRRRAAYKMLSKDNPRFKQIPVEILPSNFSSKHNDFLLTLLHVTGKKRWESIDKATFAAKLVNEHGYTPTAAAKAIGDKKLPEKIRAGEWMMEYQKATKDFDQGKFTMFLKISVNPKLKERWENDETFKPWFFRMISGKEPKISDCRDVVLLQKVPKTSTGVWINKTARKICEVQGIKAAASHLLAEDNGTHEFVEKCKSLREEIDLWGDDISPTPIMISDAKSLLTSLKEKLKSLPTESSDE